MVSVIAMGNTVQSFRDHSFLSEKLYTGTPEFGESQLLLLPARICINQPTAKVLHIKVTGHFRNNISRSKLRSLYLLGFDMFFTRQM